MELEHISHDHPLNLKEVQIDEGKDVVCYGCRKPILDTEYICGEYHYSLHKRCAELPQKTRDPIHPQHLLTLHRDSPFQSSTYICDVCKESRDRFNYFCLPCDFNICILCFLEDRMITHTIHEHPLAVLFRPASFHCNVCGEEDKESSYLCYPCQFWIHKTCASLPNTIKISDHHDSLKLVKKYFYNVTNFRQDCNICGAHIRSDSWTYCCGSCKYFVHVKCATSDRKKKLAASESDPLRGGEDEANEYLNSNIIRLPVNNDSVDLIRYFTGTINLEESMRESQMDHSSHEHPLSFFDAENYSKLKDDKLLCSGCVRPVELPFYSCLRCNYFLHFGCAWAPDKLKHPSHPKYSLELSQGTDFYSLSECNACNLDSNGFFYECRTKTCGCELNLDIKCALLPRTIKHESHVHPLDQSGGLDHRCKACNDDISRFGFGCDRCKFYLHYDCALFPHTVKHRWDRHLLILNYGPLSNHPDEYHCEYCEDEINPKYWFYHCSGDCDQSFHTACIGNANPNVMYGGTIKVDDHPHTLKFVEQEEKKSTCCSCGEPIEDVGFLECLECTYTICLECVD